MYGVAQGSKAIDRSGPSPLPDCPHLVRSLPRNSDRCGGSWLCSGAITTHQCACFMGAGSAVAQGGGAALSGGDWHRPAPDHGRSVPCGGCALGDGGWIAMQGVGCSDWRGLGRSASLGFHGNQTAGAAVRGGGCALLADPARGIPRSERGARTLAYRVASCCTPSVRRTGAGFAALVARSVPVPSPCARPMGGDL